MEGKAELPRVVKRKSKNMKSARSCGGFKKKSKPLGNIRKDDSHTFFIDS